MDYKTAAPEEVGISSQNIRQFLQAIESNRLVTHNLILMRKGKIIFEHYWAPFHREFKHRMYSVTKSFVSLAIGFLEQEGKISLDDPLIKYFPKEAAASHPFQQNQTIRHTLMMATATVDSSWFADRPADRVQHYFDRSQKGVHPSGTVFQYDSEGSFILGALAERVSGMKLMDYLKLRLFDRLGLGEIDCLECPGGHSWGDSALICRPIDLLRVAEFCMNKGEGILNEEYVTAATSKQIENAYARTSPYEQQGYGYQFWRCIDNSFYMNGMGCQFALCVPDRDLIMVYNGDNQGNARARDILFDAFFQWIARPAGEPLPPAPPVDGSHLLLRHAAGIKHSAAEQEINGKVYRLADNGMGLKDLSLTFEQEKGILRYTNEQGEKELPFGLCRNVFGVFPQSGYSDRIGGIPGKRLYQCAASAAWLSKDTLSIEVQIIDTYFGNLQMILRFCGNGIGIQMTKTAENFLQEYKGFAGGTCD